MFFSTAFPFFAEQWRNVDNDDGRVDDDEDEERQSITDLVVASVYEPSALQAANDAAGGDAETADADNVEAEQGAEEEKPAEEKKD